METFDLIIIGGGPGGYLAGERAGRAGLKTAVIEKRYLGGVCLNEGCIPSKTYLNSAKIYEYAQHGEKYGVTTTGANLNHAAVFARKNKVVKQLVAGVNLKLKHSGVTLIMGEARIAGKNGDSFKVEAAGETYAASRLLIASGSVPVIPKMPGIDESIKSGFAVTSREMFELTEAPERLAVVGGGVVGLEMANYFAYAGSKVTVLARSGIAGQTDTEISNILLKNLKNKGIVFELGCSMTDIANGCVVYDQDGESKSIDADKALVCVGRKPFTENLGLETIGVQVERGAIVADNNMRTNVPGVYATGDVNGRSMLAHTAYRESEVAVNHMLGIQDVMRYNAIPSVIYTNPEVASVGETEATAKEKGFDVKTVSLPLKYSGRYVAEVERGDGICKLVMDKERRVLLGVHMIGSYASEIIYGAAMMVETGATVDKLKEIVFPHPTVCEVIREALFEL